MRQVALSRTRFKRNGAASTPSPTEAENPASGTPIEPYAANEKIAPIRAWNRTGEREHEHAAVQGDRNRAEGRRAADAGLEGGGAGLAAEGPAGLSGRVNRQPGGFGPMNQAVTRRYSLTFSAWATNLLNHENRWASRRIAPVAAPQGTSANRRRWPADSLRRRRQATGICRWRTFSF